MPVAFSLQHVGDKKDFCVLTYKSDKSNSKVAGYLLVPCHSWLRQLPYTMQFAEEGLLAAHDNIL